MRNLFAALASLSVLAACGGGTAPQSDAAVIEINDGFIVQPIAGRDMTGGGLSATVTKGALTLVSAESDIAERIEFHTMGMEDGRMKMRQVPRFEFDSETPLVLERGGKHLMMFGVDSGLEIGDEIDVVLQFEDDQDREQFVVATMQVVGPGE